MLEEEMMEAAEMLQELTARLAPLRPKCGGRFCHSYRRVCSLHRARHSRVRSDGIAPCGSSLWGV